MSPWDQALDLMSRFITPAWDTLLQYIPLLLIGLVLLTIPAIALVWRRNASLNRSRVPAPLPAGPVPAGVHLPPPSIWPFIAPIGLFLIFLALAIGGGGTFINIPLALLGVLIGVVAAAGWYRDANREYDRLDAHDHGLHEAALIEPGAHGELILPEGVHLPGPSAWPFLAPIGIVLMFLGLVFGPLLIVGGAFMALAAGLGWYLDANREFVQVEAGHHAEPVTRDPVKVFPRWAAPTFAAVGGVVVLLTLAPWLLSLIPQQASNQGAAGPPPTTTPYLSASAATHFDQNKLVIPAQTAVTLTFDNKQDGVPHDVAIHDPADPSQFVFHGEAITGPDTIDYKLPPLAPGEYAFQCTIHPPMTGTIEVVEAPAPPG
jgi:plastocyanin